MFIRYRYKTNDYFGNKSSAKRFVVLHRIVLRKYTAEYEQVNMLEYRIYKCGIENSGT